MTESRKMTQIFEYAQINTSLGKSHHHRALLLVSVSECEIQMILPAVHEWLSTHNKKDSQLILVKIACVIMAQDSTCNQREVKHGILIAFRDNLIIVANKKLNYINKNGDYYFN